MYPDRVFRKTIEVFASSISNCTIFIFNDILIITSRKSRNKFIYKFTMKLNECSITKVDSRTSTLEDNDKTLIISHRNENIHKQNIEDIQSVIINNSG